MEFWTLAWEYKWCTIEQLKIMVKTEQSPFGDITKEKFKQITGQEYK